jgi:class 3 adenylate cyclase
VIGLSIRRKIMAIAGVLIVLMTITATVSTVLVSQSGRDIDEVNDVFLPAYRDLARANIRSLERGLDIRRMVIEKMRQDQNDARFQAARDSFSGRREEIESYIAAARRDINGLIDKGTSTQNAIGLARLDGRIDALQNETNEAINRENAALISALEAGNLSVVDAVVGRIEKLRDDLDGKLDAARDGMAQILVANTAEVRSNQHRVILVSALLTFLSAVLGIVFSLLVSHRLTEPVRRLLEGARSVAAGRLDAKLPVQSNDEIGRLTDTFNNMIDQLREKERLRETFGRYVDPRVVEGLLNRPDMANQGQRRVMTVMFCDIKGFTESAERMTPDGLVKVMNRYFSVMSEVIRQHGGVVDKYIGDAIMAYWGAPFVDDKDQAKLAIGAALDMLARVAILSAAFPEILGLRTLPIDFDIRIGIATGDVLVGSIGSDVMMNYTVLGDTVNFASRLEGVNKVYGSHLLVSEATLHRSGDTFETREIDRVVVLGQSQIQPIYEVLGPKGKPTSDQLELRDHYAKGLAAYRTQRWDDARGAFGEALRLAPDDKPSAALLARIAALESSPPPSKWDGVWHLDHK